MDWNEPDQVRVVRNTRTLDAYRTRMKAASRASMPFILLPMFFNPAIYIPLLQRSSHHISTWMLASICLVWLALMCASIAFGVYRRQKYLRDHPFTES
jgi:hypothetical protein